MRTIPKTLLLKVDANIKSDFNKCLNWGDKEWEEFFLTVIIHDYKDKANE